MDNMSCGFVCILEIKCLEWLIIHVICFLGTWNGGAGKEGRPHILLKSETKNGARVETRWNRWWQIHLYLSKCLFHIQTSSNYTSYENILQARWNLVFFVEYLVAVFFIHVKCCMNYILKKEIEVVATYGHWTSFISVLQCPAAPSKQRKC
jgi:hypothetical protein